MVTHIASRTCGGKQVVIENKLLIRYCCRSKQMPEQMELPTELYAGAPTSELPSNRSTMDYIIHRNKGIIENVAMTFNFTGNTG